MESSGRNLEYDGLKGIAIIGIMFVHIMSWSGLAGKSDFMNRISNFGSYGVEITFVLNAMLQSKSYENWRGGVFKFVLKNILGILPVYWLGLIVHIIIEWITIGSIYQDRIGVLLHFFLLHGISPLHWNLFGMGYMGILIILWIIFPLYLRRIDSLKLSLFAGVSICIVGQVLYYALILKSPITVTQEWYTWLYYMLRGLYCYSIGNIVYYAKKEMSSDGVGVTYKLLFIIASVAYIVLNILIYSVDHFMFAVMVGAIIWLIPSGVTSVLRLPLFVHLGKYIFELYVGHVTLYYVLVLYTKVLSTEYQIIFGIVLATVIFSIVVKKFYSDPLRRFLTSRFIGKREKI